MSDSCGTGRGGVVYPGDPGDLNSGTLSATAALLGIHLFWTLPNIRPEAVSFILVYRNTIADFDSAALIGRGAGDHYLDNILPEEIGREYFYWIRYVTINGTIGQPIGPASAVMQPPWETILEMLEGRLDESTLNQALRTRIIGGIDNLQSALGTEREQRLLGENVISGFLQDLQGSLGDVDALIRNEVIERQNGDSVVLAEVDVKIAQFKQDTAAAIVGEEIVYADPDRAIAEAIRTLSVATEEGTAALQILQGTQGGPDGLAAQFMVKTDVNGYVSGYGLYNDGATSEFIVNVDRFAVATPGNNPSYPFIIDRVNGQTVIVLNAATFIPDASITNAKIGGSLFSENFNLVDTGWAIAQNGNAVFHNIYARGDIRASEIDAGIITAENIRGGAVSRVYQESRSGFNLGAGQESKAFAFLPQITQGLLGNVICMVHFQAQAQGQATNVGVKVVRVRPNGQRSTIHTNAISAATNLTSGSATSFSDENIQPGTLYEVYMTNTWNQGSFVDGRVGGNMMLTLM